VLVGRQEGCPAFKKRGCWFVGGNDLTGALYVLQLWLSPPPTYITLNSNEIQNRDILVPANPGPPGKTAVRMERVRMCVTELNRGGVVWTNGCKIL